MYESQDDAIAWANFTPRAHAAELERMADLIPDPARASSLLDFGLRPVGPMDLDLYDQPNGLSKPWEPKKDDLSPEPLLADTASGWRFRVEPGTSELRLDISSSDNFLEAQTLHVRAKARDKGRFTFRTHYLPSFHGSQGSGSDFPVVKPIELVANSRAELEDHIDGLGDLFCGHLPVKRLWFRGQRQEYVFPRDAELSTALYGGPLPSLTPSLDRYAKAHPDKMNFGFAWVGPNHYWKKPFLIWQMRQNPQWFNHDDRFMPYLADILADPNDHRFSELLLKIQMSPIEIGEPPHLPWPDEADDLQQWFFVHMKRREFAVTLQQYGYHTSLLDLTDDLSVALYFSQASMVDGAMRCAPSNPGRVLYVLAESRGNFFHHGAELAWSSEGWQSQQPPRLGRQKAGFIKGATSRNQNFYGMMVIARITLGDHEPETNLTDNDLFPAEIDDLLLRTLKASRPELEGLY